MGINHRSWNSLLIAAAILSAHVPGSNAAPALAEDGVRPATRISPEYNLKLETIQRGYDGKTCWVHPRAGLIPGDKPLVVMTMMRLQVSGSDLFLPINDVKTADFGRTWTEPRERAEAFSRRTEPGNVECGVCDFTPAWHAPSKTLLAIGQTVRYRNDKVIAERPRETAWSVYDPVADVWSGWQVLTMPDEARFYNCGAGSVQRVDLADGTILLPVYFRAKGDKDYQVAVLTCQFDGTRLTYQGVSNAMTVPGGRGLYEPSLTHFDGRYLLTLRNDAAGYVAVSDDGRQFGPPIPWKWDDGGELGNYNTQQHWVTHSDGLFLVYTRKGAGNDHVFRHRAPLFIAQVDPKTPTVIRATERVLVPERGARLGNFGVLNVSADETWVSVAEWMQTWSPQTIIPPDNPRGADNSVYVARIQWKKANRNWLSPPTAKATRRFD